MYENAVSQSKFYRNKKGHLTWKIDDFSGLATLFEQLDKSGRLVLTDMIIFKILIWT